MCFMVHSHCFSFPCKDYFGECEGQSEVFNKMYEAGLSAADDYKPSDTLQETLADALKQWTEFVQSLGQ